MADRSEETNGQVKVVQQMPRPNALGIQCLPPELLLTIFSKAVDVEGVPFLGRVASVCRSWRDIAVDSQLWREVDLSRGKMKRDSSTFRWLVDNRLSKVIKLNLSSWEELKLEDYRYLYSSCRQLRSLDLTNCNLTRSAVKELSSLPQLQSVKLSRVPPKSIAPTVICCMLRKMGPRLRELDLSGNCIRGCDFILNALMDNCPNLTLLDLSRNIYSSPIRLNIEKLQRCCTKLRVLRLEDTELPAVEADMKTKMASPGFPYLEELNLSVTFIPDLLMFIYDNDFICRVLKNSPRLRKLDVSTSVNISPELLLLLPAQRLRNLRLSFFFQDIFTILPEIVTKWKDSLENVDVSWNRISMDEVDQVLCTMIEHGTPLRALNLSGTDVSIESVRRVLAGCQHLTTLDLTYCKLLPRGARRCHDGQDALDELLKLLSLSY